MDKRILQRIAEENPLQSLTPEERREDTLPVTRDPKPKACKAWVRFGPHAMLVDAVVVVWNVLACGIQFSVGELAGLVYSNCVNSSGQVCRSAA